MTINTTTPAPAQNPAPAQQQGISIEQLVKLFYVALWNEEIDKAIKQFPRVEPIFPITGPKGFYSYFQQFGVAVRSNEISASLDEGIAFQGAWSTISNTINTKIAALAERAPLLTRCDSLAEHTIIVNIFNEIADLAKSNRIGTMQHVLENFHTRMQNYVASNINGEDRMMKADLEVAFEYMPSLINVILRNIGAERINFLKVMMIQSYYPMPSRAQLLNQQTPEHQTEMFDFIINTPAVLNDFLTTVENIEGDQTVASQLYVIHFLVVCDKSERSIKFARDIVQHIVNHGTQSDLMLFQRFYPEVALPEKQQQTLPTRPKISLRG